MSRVASILWHAPGRTWAGMMRAGSLATWAQIGAGLAGTAIFIGYGLVIWKGPWPDAQSGKQLDLLGQGQLIAGVLIFLSLAAIAGLKLAVNAGKDGFHASAERDDEPASPVVVTTTTTVEAPTDPTRTP